MLRERESYCLALEEVRRFGSGYEQHEGSYDDERDKLEVVEASVD